MENEDAKSVSKNKIDTSTKQDTSCKDTSFALDNYDSRKLKISPLSLNLSMPEESRGAGGSEIYLRELSPSVKINTEIKKVNEEVAECVPQEDGSSTGDVDHKMVPLPIDLVEEQRTTGGSKKVESSLKRKLEDTSNFQDSNSSDKESQDFKKRYIAETKKSLQRQVSETENYQIKVEAASEEDKRIKREASLFSECDNDVRDVNKPYTCPYCLEIFAIADKLAEHFEIKHKGTSLIRSSEELFNISKGFPGCPTCLECEEIFTDWETISHHTCRTTNSLKELEKVCSTKPSDITFIKKFQLTEKPESTINQSSFRISGSVPKCFVSAPTLMRENWSGEPAQCSDFISTTRNDGPAVSNSHKTKKKSIEESSSSDIKSIDMDLAKKNESISREAGDGSESLDQEDPVSNRCLSTTNPVHFNSKAEEIKKTTEVYKIIVGEELEDDDQPSKEIEEDNKQHNKMDNKFNMEHDKVDSGRSSMELDTVDENNVEVNEVDYESNKEQKEVHNKNNISEDRSDKDKSDAVDDEVKENEEYKESNGENNEQKESNKNGASNSANENNTTSNEDNESVDSDYSATFTALSGDDTDECNSKSENDDTENRNNTKSNDENADHLESESQAMTNNCEELMNGRNDERQSQKGEDVIETSSSFEGGILQIASKEVMPMVLTLEDKMESLSTQSVIKECIRTSCNTCSYCNHAVKIGVNGKQLAAHLLAQHRYKPVTNEKITDVIDKLKNAMSELEDVWLNADSYDSSDKSCFISFNHTFECFQCDFKTNMLKNLDSHKQRKHKNSIFYCCMCKANFHCYSELLCHMCPGLYVYSEDIQFRCCFCEMDRIPSAFRLMVHLRNTHHACNFCLEIPGDQKQLSNHINKHRKYNNNYCYRCGIAYSQKPHLQQHLFFKHCTESVLCKKCLQKKWPYIYHFCIPPTVKEEVEEIIVVDSDVESEKVPIKESNLNTDENSTEEDFYDQYPQRHANQMLAEKKNILVAIPPSAPCLVSQYSRELSSTTQLSSTLQDNSRRLLKCRQEPNKLYEVSSDEEEKIQQTKGLSPAAVSIEKWRRVEKTPPKPVQYQTMQEEFVLQYSSEVERPPVAATAVSSSSSYMSSTSGPRSGCEPHSTVINEPHTEKDIQIYCYCQCPYDEVSNMIGCDGHDCQFKWFHFECVNIIEPPNGDWFCPDCKKQMNLI